MNSFIHEIGWFIIEGLSKSALLLLVAIVMHAAIQKRYPLACTAMWHACFVGLMLLPFGMICFPSWGTGFWSTSIAARRLFRPASTEAKRVESSLPLPAD